METATNAVGNGLWLIESTLREQCYDGLPVVNANIGFGNDNLWGYLYMIVPHDKVLAEKVRRSFLKKSPQEALALVKQIRREFIHAVLNGG